ncbi:MAG TPA: permease prefix domain 1-containing protein, partial [Terriglobia bacterium]|nr:permease prefix domain 1-containing protein [Terriglobia bacterium]
GAARFVEGHVGRIGEQSASEVLRTYDGGAQTAAGGDRRLEPAGGGHRSGSQRSRRSRVEREMEEEFRSHIQNRADDLEQQGMSRTEAERQARIEFGGYQRYKEECREALGTRLLGELIADLCYGLRQPRCGTSKSSDE